MEPTALVSVLESAPASVLILDVRDSDAEGGHITGAIHVPDSTFVGRLEEVLGLVRSRKPALIVLHCMESVARGPRCARRLFDAFGAAAPEAANIRVLRGGADGWIRKHFANSTLVEGFDVEYWWGAGAKEEDGVTS